MRMSLQTIALGAVLAMSSANVFAAQFSHVENRSCAGTPSLIQIDSSAGTDPLAYGTDHMVNIGKPATISTIAMSTSSGACGVTGLGSADGDFPTSATYIGSFGMFLDTGNSKPARIPLSMFHENTNPSPGSNWTTVSSMDSNRSCWLTDGSGTTVWAKKICLFQ